MVYRTRTKLDSLLVRYVITVNAVIKVVVLNVTHPHVSDELRGGRLQQGLQS